jgi:DNA mismatch endonuclease (patch repair protein)
MDTLDRQERSRQMALVHSSDTKPELVLRKLVYSLGYRYRLHRRDLPGAPDLVFFRARRVIFVHGCFWHQHSCPNGDRTPKSHVAFWRKKLAGNVIRDRRTLARLRRKGWRALVVWECQLKDTERLKLRLLRFLAKR